jgi:hypothetical protein
MSVSTFVKIEYEIWKGLALTGLFTFAESVSRFRFTYAESDSAYVAKPPLGGAELGRRSREPRSANGRQPSGGQGTESRAAQLWMPLRQHNWAEIPNT